MDNMNDHEMKYHVHAFLGELQSSQPLTDMISRGISRGRPRCAAGVSPRETPQEARELGLRWTAGARRRWRSLKNSVGLDNYCMINGWTIIW